MRSIRDIGCRLACRVRGSIRLTSMFCLTSLSDLAVGLATSTGGFARTYVFADLDGRICTDSCVCRPQGEDLFGLMCLPTSDGGFSSDLCVCRPRLEDFVRAYVSADLSWRICLDHALSPRSRAILAPRAALARSRALALSRSRALATRSRALALSRSRTALAR